MEVLYIMGALVVGFIAGNYLGSRVADAIGAEFQKLKADLIAAVQAEVKKL